MKQSSHLDGLEWNWQFQTVKTTSGLLFTGLDVYQSEICTPIVEVCFSIVIEHSSHFGQIRMELTTTFNQSRQPKIGLLFTGLHIYQTEICTLIVVLKQGLHHRPSHPKRAQKIR